MSWLQQLLQFISKLSSADFTIVSKNNTLLLINNCSKGQTAAGVSEGGVVHGYPVTSEKQWVVNFVLFGKSTDRIFTVEGNSENCDILRTMALIELDKSWNFAPTRQAPRSPEVNYQNLPAQVADRGLLGSEAGERNGRQFKAVFWGWS